MSKVKRVQPSSNTKSRLYADSAGYCAIDMKPLIHFDTKMVGRIAHIKAAKPGGARFDENMTEEERADYNNLIYICQACHDYVDDKAYEDEWPVERLIQKKQDHIDKMAAMRNSFINLTDGVDYVRPVTLRYFFTVPGVAFNQDYYDEFIEDELIQFNTFIDEFRQISPNVRRFYKEIVELSDKDKETVSFALVKETLHMESDQLRRYITILVDKKLLVYDEDYDQFEFRIRGIHEIDDDFISRLAHFKRQGYDILEESFVNLDFSWAD